MNKQLLKDSLGWGFILWLVGYALGMMFFVVVPPALIGWFVMPIGIVVALWILFNKIKDSVLSHYIIMAVVWAVIAVIFDYLFLIKPFHLVATYYKPDVYVYYGLTFLLPIVVGRFKIMKKN